MQNKNQFFRRTKIIATLGPATSSKKVLSELIKEGVDVIRINFSHGEASDHIKNIKIIRELSKQFKKNVAVLGDLCGPKIRVGKFENGSIFLKTNSYVEIAIKKNIAADIYTDFKSLTKQIKLGQRILLDDGKLELTVTSKEKYSIQAKVKRGGILKDNKGMNLPDTVLKLPSLTVKDKLDIKSCIEAEVDYIALSFVRTSKNIMDLKNYLKKNNAEIPVISKIEKPEALTNIDSIIEVSDAIMIARGDLGVEMSPQKVPLIQNQLVELSKKCNIPVIVATQILESMISNSMPTRAEVTDVSSACLSGTDAVMLSGETAVGKYPLETIKMMKTILIEIENYILTTKQHTKTDSCKKNILQNAIANATSQLSDDLNVSCIIALTRSGKTAQFVSCDRPTAPIIAFTQDKKVVNQLKLFWGVYPFLVDKEMSLDEFIKLAELISINQKFSKKADYLILLSGLANNNLMTNSIFIHKIGV
jgi:pyruvate kinase